jgi:hypothetical protein
VQPGIYNLVSINQYRRLDMIEVSGTAIFWFISLGLVVGLLFGAIIKKEGVSVPINIFWGVTGSIGTGIIAIVLGFGDGLLFAMAGSLCILFLVNAFHHHHVEDVYGHIDRGISIKKKQANK